MQFLWGLGVPNGDYWVSVLSYGPMDWIFEDGGWEMLWDLTGHIYILYILY